MPPPSEQGEGSHSTSLALVPPKAQKLQTRRKPNMPPPSEQGQHVASASTSGTRSSAKEPSGDRISEETFQMISCKLNEVVELTKELEKIRNRVETGDAEEEDLDKTTIKGLLADTESLSEKFKQHNSYQRSICNKKNKQKEERILMTPTVSDEDGEEEEVATTTNDNAEATNDDAGAVAEVIPQPAESITHAKLSTATTKKSDVHSTTVTEVRNNVILSYITFWLPL